MMRARFWVWAGLGLFGSALADDDDHDSDDEHERRGGERSRGGDVRPGVAPVADAAWASECGSCHLAYPPGLLPSRSWALILGNLGSHFGDDASVDDRTRDALLAYALTNAADVAPYGLSRAVARATEGRQVERITEIGFIAHEHAEVGRSGLARAGLKSFAQCSACHRGAAEGRFGEHEIALPNGVRWED